MVKVTVKVKVKITKAHIKNNIHKQNYNIPKVKHKGTHSERYCCHKSEALKAIVI